MGPMLNPQFKTPFFLAQSAPSGRILYKFEASSCLHVNGFNLGLSLTLIRQATNTEYPVCIVWIGQNHIHIYYIYIYIYPVCIVWIGQNHIYIRYSHGIFGRQITKYTVIYGAYIYGSVQPYVYVAGLLFLNSPCTYRHTLTHTITHTLIHTHTACTGQGHDGGGLEWRQHLVPLLHKVRVNCFCADAPVGVCPLLFCADALVGVCSLLFCAKTPVGAYSML
jgi:hypothetical protein